MEEEELSILKKTLIYNLIEIVLKYLPDYKSKEYILHFDTCRKFGNVNWADEQCANLSCREINNIVIKSEMNRKLNWGDVVRTENEEYRNHGRSFWIDDQIIPFFQGYDDYGSIYPWMTCNKIGNTLCWQGTADGHGNFIFFNHTGYKIREIVSIEYIRYDKKCTGYVGTLVNDQCEEWYIFSDTSEIQFHDSDGFKFDDINSDEEDDDEDEEEGEEEYKKYNYWPANCAAYLFDSAPREVLEKYPKNRLLEMF
jgi:hypothetical protein